MSQYTIGAEVILLRKRHLRYLMLLLSLDFLGLIIAILLLIPVLPLFSAGARRFDMLGQGILIICLLIVLSSFIFLLIVVLRRWLQPHAAYRVSQDGLHFPAPVSWLSYEGVPFSVLIRWQEIKMIVPYYAHFGKDVAHDIPMLGIVLWEYEGFLARLMQEHRPGSLRRLFLRRQTQRLSRLVAPVNIPGGMVSISIDELLSQIRTCFAAELQEHNITILEWQY